MARINIDDSLFKDSRYINLLIKVGDKDKALGIVVSAWMVAQRFFLNEKYDRLIPFSAWENQGCSNLLLEFGLAEKREKGVYVMGSNDQFGWLIQRSEAGKRKMGGADSHQEKQIVNKTGVQRLGTGRNGSEPLTLPLTHKKNCRS